MGITWDLLFSYWLFSWFLIYYAFLHISGRGFIFTFIKKAMNPIMGLIIASFENVVTLILLSYSNSNMLTLLKYSFSILLFKFLPIYLLSYFQVNIVYSFIAFLAAFAVYLIYIIYKDQDLLSIYRFTFDALESNRNDTPFFKLLSKFSETSFS